MTTPKKPWPASIDSEADAIALVECLVAEGRTFHFDTDPEEVGLFTQPELVTLARFESYCEQFRPAGKKGHGIWWIIEKHPHIEKLLGLSPTNPITPPGWELTETGGGCTGFERVIEGKPYEMGWLWLITDEGDPSAPTNPSEPVCLGLYINGSVILQWHCSCLAEAVQIAEGAKP